MFDFPYGGHIFVMARPKVREWREFDGTFLNRDNREFRPCMISGWNESQRVFVHGSQYAYMLDDFEFGERLG